MTMRKVYKKSHRSTSLVRRQSMREVKQSFLIVCEGVRTEPDYFRAFRMTAATVKAVGQAMNTTSLVSKAISIRDSEGFQRCHCLCRKKWIQGGLQQPGV